MGIHLCQRLFGKNDKSTKGKSKNTISLILECTCLHWLPLSSPQSPSKGSSTTALHNLGIITHEQTCAPNCLMETKERQKRITQSHDGITVPGPPQQHNGANKTGESESPITNLRSLTKDQLSRIQSRPLPLWYGAKRRSSVGEPSEESDDEYLPTLYQVTDIGIVMRGAEVIDIPRVI